MSKSIGRNASEIDNAEIYQINNAIAFLNNNADGLQFKIVTRFKNKNATNLLKDNVEENAKKSQETKVEEFQSFLV